MPKVGAKTIAVTALTAMGAGTLPHAALGLDAEVSSDTTFQSYDVASPWSNYDLERRRITESAGISLYHLQGKYAPGKPDYSMRVMFRLDADPGVNAHLPRSEAGGETDFSVGQGSRYIPTLYPYRFDLLYGYVEGRNVGKGWLGFKLGRQYLTDVLGWWSFDGALVKITTPYFIGIEAYGGLEQRGGLPLSSSRFESQGVWRGGHGDFGNAPTDPHFADYPSYQFNAPAPAFGFAAESNGPNWLHGRFDYRRVYNTGESFTRQYPDPNGGTPALHGLRLSSDRLGYALNANLPNIGGVKGGFSYDFYNQVFPYAYAGIEGYLGKRVTIGGDFDWYQPTFDADSIWNWFTHEPQATGTARLEARPTKDFDFSASGGAKVFFTEGNSKTFATGECTAAATEVDPKTGQPLIDPKTGQPKVDFSCPTTGFDAANSNGVAAYLSNPSNNQRTALVDGVGQLAARYRVKRAHFEFRGMAESGARGRRVGGDLSGEGNVDGGKWSFGGRFSVYNFEDPLRNQAGGAQPVANPGEATSIGYVLGIGWHPLDLSRITLEWEHDYNRLVGQRFRVLATLAVLWIK